MQRILVTGGSQGIGLAIVEKFLAEGYQVDTCAREPDRLPAQVRAHPNLSVHQADLSIPVEAESLARRILAAGAAPDVLVHNAGVFAPGHIINEPAGQLEGQLAGNVGSAYHLTRGLLPAMLARQTGYIFTMCSVASIKGYPAGGSYTISKHALLGLTRELREELKSTPIRVTAVLPGAVYTPAWAGAGLPESRFIPAADIADLIFALAQTSPSTVVEELLVRPQLGDI